MFFTTAKLTSSLRTSESPVVKNIVKTRQLCRVLTKIFYHRGLRGTQRRLRYIFSAFLWLILSTAATAVSADAQSCDRIISLAPSITETLYELGLGDHVIGVTRFDKYPPEVKTKAQVGGFLDPNYEAILALKPSVVVFLPEQKDEGSRLKELGVKTLSVNHKNINGILSSIETLGSFCGRLEKATTLVTSLKGRVDAILSRTTPLKKIRTMIAIGDGDDLTHLFVSGEDGYYSEALHIAGGENVYDGKTISLPSISSEGILNVNPEVVIVIGYHNDRVEATRGKVFSVLPGGKNTKVYVLADDYMSVPGPRFVKVIEQFAKILHPEVL